MKVLSLFDGMACGMIAMQNAGVRVDRYVAFEFDVESASESKGRPYGYAAYTAKHNFPMIESRGNVFGANFTEFEGFDWLIRGSPCTYWSIAQKNNRETEASGMGWELFSQYVRALHEAKPRFFIYENNKSMSNAIRQSISEAFGFEPICINSALVSAQNRQRLYWVGKRNEDGTYSKVDVKQPQDRGILLKDILEDCVVDKDKAYCLKHQAGNARDYFKKHHTQIKFEPVCVAERGRYNSNREVEQHFEAREDGKTNVLTTVQKDNNVAEPVRVGALPRPNGELSQSQAFRIYSIEGKSININAGGGGAGGKTGSYAVPLSQTLQKRIPEIVDKYGYLPEMFNAYNRTEIINKAPTLSTGSMETSSCAVNRLENICVYAIPCEWDEEGTPTKAISATDGKTYTVYKVQDGLITIKDKQYPIKLPNGYYIIRKLTVRECMRLQTVPEWYEFPVSDTQAYKMLGNGWTCDVITILILAALSQRKELEWHD